MIALVDYGLGNLKAFANVYKKLNIPFLIAHDPTDLKKADKIILPGVGAFDYAMERLNKSGMRETLDELALGNKVPVLGVCVGMQIMAHSSEEGNLRGLSWIDGIVKKFDPTVFRHSTRLPHMGWNDVKPLTDDSLLKGLESEAQFYFLHSFYFQCNNKKNILANSEYGCEFAAAVNSGNIYGVQFHPEKSHNWGMLLLKNFATL